MQKLTDLTLEQLLALYDECIEAHEQQISDECFKRYGISLTESNQTWWQRNNFFIGLICGMLLLIPINVIVVLIEDYT
jgi:hypothetical protein|tara:strand:+ start:456 stop:689 length:234 start_codon:yes stop_codon:yes gene_type:complete